jgi:hypothetical protein
MCDILDMGTISVCLLGTPLFFAFDVFKFEGGAVQNIINR